MPVACEGTVVCDGHRLNVTGLPRATCYFYHFRDATTDVLPSRRVDTFFAWEDCPKGEPRRSAGAVRLSHRSRQGPDGHATSVRGVRPGVGRGRTPHGGDSNRSLRRQTSRSRVQVPRGGRAARTTAHSGNQNSRANIRCRNGSRNRGRRARRDRPRCSGHAYASDT